MEKQIEEAIKEYKESLERAEFDNERKSYMLDAFVEGINFCRELYKEPVQRLKTNFENYQKLFAELKARVEEMEGQKNADGSKVDTGSC